MSRWFDADEVEKLMKCGCAYAIWKLPSIDLVICEECKFWSENTQFCHMFSTRFTAQRMLPNDFCSLGVKKENE